MDDSRKCVYCPAVYSSFEIMLIHLRTDHGAFQQAMILRAREDAINKEVSEFANFLEEL